MATPIAPWASQTTLGEIVTRVTAILADSDAVQPNTRWPVAELVDYSNEALREILLRRPEAFTVALTISLQPGSLQRIDPKYQSLYSIEEAYDTLGRAYNVSEVDYRYSRLITKTVFKTASLGAPYMVRTFTKHPLDDQIFMVDPPVPPGVVPAVLGVVVQRPLRFTVTDLTRNVAMRPEYEAQLVDFMLYRALSKDLDSEHQRAAAQGYLASFNSALEHKSNSRREYHNSDSGMRGEKPNPLLGGKQ